MRTNSLATITPLHESLALLEPLVDAVWTEIAAQGQGREHTRVLVTSPSAKAGTSLITAATGAALARFLRSQVLVVETNLRCPGIAGFTGIDGLPGLSDLLLGHADLDEVIREVPGVPGLRVLPAGTSRAAISGEYATPKAQALFANLATMGRYVLFDTPTLLEHREGRSLFPLIDHVLLVLRARDTSKANTGAVVQLIQRSHVPLLGTVLNRHVPELGFLER